MAVQIKRNEIISRFGSTRGHTSAWDGELVLKIVLIGLVPLVALFAREFPDAGGALLRWLTPVQKALP